MSLSTRLRADADIARNKSLPTLLYHPKKTNPFSPKRLPQQPYSADELRQTFQRLSGSYDSEGILNAYPERGSSKNSSILCVRCSEPASICTQCSESLIENSLNFYKVSRARGAVILFQNAITQAGAAKTLRFVMFHIWKNSFTSRSRMKNRKQFIAEKKFRRSLCLKPFLAWRKYIFNRLLERKDKMFEQLNEKIKELESNITNLINDKKQADKNDLELKAEISARDIELSRRHKENLTLHEELAKERVRVIGICGLTEPIQVFSLLMEEAANNQASSLNVGLNNMGSKGLTHDYSRIFDLQIKELVKQQKKKAQTQTYSRSHNLHSETKDEAKISTKMMLDWINAISRDAGLRVDPGTGKNLSKYLPTFSRTVDFKDLQNGKQLCRVIVSLIFDACDNQSDNEDARQCLTADQLDDIRSSNNNPDILLRTCLSHATFFLHIPLYRVSDILQNSPGTIQSLVGQLMLLAPPVLHPEDMRILSSEINKYNDITDSLAKLQQDMSSQQYLSRLHNAWSSMQDMSQNMLSRVMSSDATRRPSIANRHPSIAFANYTVPDEVGAALDDSAVTRKRSLTDASVRNSIDQAIDNFIEASSATAIEAATGGASSPQTLNVEPFKKSYRRLKSVERRAGSDSSNDNGFHPKFTEWSNRPTVAKVEVDGMYIDADVASRYPTGTLGRKYDMLSGIVDEFLRQAGDKRLLGFIVRLGRNMRDLGKLREDLDRINQNYGDGVRLAVDVRQHVMAHNLISVLRIVGWLTDEEVAE